MFHYAGVPLSTILRKKFWNFNYETEAHISFRRSKNSISYSQLLLTLAQTPSYQIFLSKPFLFEIWRSRWCRCNFKSSGISLCVDWYLTVQQSQLQSHLIYRKFCPSKSPVLWHIIFVVATHRGLKGTHTKLWMKRLSKRSPQDAHFKNYDRM